MSEEETPQDPFISPDTTEIMQGLYACYASALQAGFPEHRAFELVHDFFITQMASVQQAMIRRAEQEG